VPSEFPPQLSRRAKVAIGAVALLTLLYTVVVTAQILLWFILVGVAVGLYLTYLLIVALFRLVEAVERIATAAEAESRTRDAPGTAAADAGDPDPVADRRGDTAAPGGGDGAERPASTTEAGEHDESGGPDISDESGGPETPTGSEGSDAAERPDTDDGDGHDASDDPDRDPADRSERD